MIDYDRPDHEGQIAVDILRYMESMTTENFEWDMLKCKHLIYEDDEKFFSEKLRERAFHLTITGKALPSKKGLARIEQKLDRVILADQILSYITNNFIYHDKDINKKEGEISKQI